MLEKNYIYEKNPIYSDFRVGDIRHFYASIVKAFKLLGYTRKVYFRYFSQRIDWYSKHIIFDLRYKLAEQKQ